MLWNQRRPDFVGEFWLEDSMLLLGGMGVLEPWVYTGGFLKGH